MCTNIQLNKPKVEIELFEVQWVKFRGTRSKQWERLIGLGETGMLRHFKHLCSEESKVQSTKFARGHIKAILLKTIIFVAILV